MSSNPLMLSLLPQDVLEEILSRLPVESILRFKCVCKSWYALFNNPSFQAKHLQLVKANHGNQHVFLKHSLTDEDGKKKWVTCFFPDDYTFGKDERELGGDFFYDVPPNDWLSLIGHCDGIVALSLGFSSSDGVILCNPATRQSCTLPNSSFYPIPYGSNLEYRDDSFQPHPSDDSFQPHPREIGEVPFDYVFNNFIGFGYDHKTKDYKVVRDVVFLWFESGMVNHKVEVFSIGTDSSWREINGDAIGNTRYRSQEDSHFEQYFDGFHYWWGWDTTDGEIKYFLILFDMANEIFQKTPMPDFSTYARDNFFYYSRIGVYNNECIALYIVPFPGDGGCMDVWVMRESGVQESWTKQLSIVSTPWYHPLLFWKNDEELLHVEEQESIISEDEWHFPRQSLYSYNLITQESKYLPLPGDNILACRDYFSACRYMKTIVSVNAGEEVINVT